MRLHPGRRWTARLAGLSLAAAALLLFFPAAASAHAVPVSATPAPGARLGTAPGAVTVVFDEPLVARLSGTTVTAPGGQRFTGTVTGKKTIRVPLTASARGVYRVDWKTVSVIDGHTITGSYRFGVGVPVTAAASSAGATAQGPGAADVVVAAARWAEYSLLLLACGLSLLGLLARDLAPRLPAVPVAAALLAGGVVVVAVEAGLASSGVSVAGFVDYLSNGVTGWARVARLLLEAAVLETAIIRRAAEPGRRPPAPVPAESEPAGVSVVDAWLSAHSGQSGHGGRGPQPGPEGRQGSHGSQGPQPGTAGSGIAPGPPGDSAAPGRPGLSPVLLAGAVTAVAIAGHGADVEPAWQGIAVNAVHLAAAGLWAGGIMALALLGITGHWQAVRRDLLPRFARVAPWAFAVSVLLGAVQAWQLLGGPGQVLTTGYGLTLVAKAVAVAAIAPLSLLAWRRNRVNVRAEAVLVVVVIAAAAALAAYPVVPKEAREAAGGAAAGAPAARLSWIPRPGDLTMGGRAGQVMVGLTVHPGRPGRNTVTAYLASPATAASQARIQLGGRWQALSSCGGQCRAGTVTLHGGERLAVAVSGRGGGTGYFTLPTLPARDGAAMARAAVARMDRLDSYLVAENLSGIRSAYAYARPHQIWVRTWYGDGIQQTLWTGRKVYAKTTPDGPWRLKSSGTLAPVPYYPWDPFKPFEDARIVGTGTVSGRPVTVVSSFAGHGSDPDAVWFTLYVDQRTGRVLQSRMWATNHFMTDRYHGFSQPGRLPRPPRHR